MSRQDGELVDRLRTRIAELEAQLSALREMINDAGPCQIECGKSSFYKGPAFKCVKCRCRDILTAPTKG